MSKNRFPTSNLEKNSYSLFFIIIKKKNQLPLFFLALRVIFLFLILLFLRLVFLRLRLVFLRLVVRLAGFFNSCRQAGE